MMSFMRKYSPLLPSCPHFRDVRTHRFHAYISIDDDGMLFDVPAMTRP
jgi:hypothetical protein